MKAAEQNSTIGVNILIQNGASVHTKDDNGNTALYLAIRNAEQDGTDCVKALIQAAQKVGVLVLDEDRNFTLGTALRLAAVRGRSETLKLLIKQGASVDYYIQDYKMSPLMNLAS